MTVNTTSPLIAAQQAILSFEKLPKGTPKTYIFTGNALNRVIWPIFWSFSMGKSATDRLIGHAAEIYKDEEWK
jgi:hypothetical protein